MASSTHIDPEGGAQRGSPAQASGRCALLSLCPAPTADKLRAALSPLSLEALDAATPEALRDALYDREVVIAFVFFGRDVPQGIATCRAIRKHPSGRQVPIIAILDPTVLSGYPLDCGADDVMLAPLVPEEAALRARLALWRSDIPVSEEVIKLGDLVVDPTGMRARLNGEPVDLTFKEFALLRYFLENRGVALPRERILEVVWGEDYYGGDRTVDIHVRRLRAKLPPLSEHIETVHGVGYRCA